MGKEMNKLCRSYQSMRRVCSSGKAVAPEIVVVVVCHDGNSQLILPTV